MTRAPAGPRSTNWPRLLVFLCVVLMWTACSKDDDEECGFGRFGQRLDAALRQAVAEEHYEADPTWTTTRMIEVAAGELQQQGEPVSDPDFFIDTDSSDHRGIKAVDDMSDDELVAYNAWLKSSLVGEATGGTQALAMSTLRPHLDRLADRYCE